MYSYLEVGTGYHPYSNGICYQWATYITSVHHLKATGLVEQMNPTIQEAIIKCINDQQDRVECLDSALLISFHYQRSKYRHVSNDDDVW